MTSCGALERAMDINGMPDTIIDDMDPMLDDISSPTSQEEVRPMTPPDFLAHHDTVPRESFKRLAPPQRHTHLATFGAALTSLGSAGTVYVNQTLRKAQTYAETTRSELRRVAPTSPRRRQQYPTPGVPHTTYAELTTKYPSTISHIVSPNNSNLVRRSSPREMAPIEGGSNLSLRSASSALGMKLAPIPEALREVWAKAAEAAEGAAAGVTGDGKGAGRRFPNRRVPVARTPEEEEAILNSIPDLVSTLSGFDASPEEQQQAAVTLRETLQTAGPMFNAVREATIDAEAIPALLQLVYSSPEVGEVCWILQLLGASLDPEDRCKRAILDEHGVVMLIDVCERAGLSESARAHCLAALYNLAIGCDDLLDVYAQSTELLRAILADIREGEAFGAQPGLRLLRLITSDTDDARLTRLTEHGVLDAVVDRFKMDGPLSNAQVAALPCLLNLVKGSAERAQRVAVLDANGGRLTARLMELRRLLQNKACPSLLERGMASVVALAMGPAFASSKSDPKAQSASADKALKDVDEVLARMRVGRRLSVEGGSTPRSSLETPSSSTGWATIAEDGADNAVTQSEGGASTTTGPQNKLVNAMRGAWGNAPARLASAKRKLALFGATATGFASNTGTRNATETDKPTWDEPVLDPDDPNEVMMRVVTEKTLRKEFMKAGGRCTPAQIAGRFKKSLNDREYGPENRVRFRDIIDRICVPEKAVENGETVFYLQLRPDLPPIQTRTPPRASAPNSPPRHKGDTAVVVDAAPEPHDTTVVPVHEHRSSPTSVVSLS
eukprot:m.30309 g.30309  ORF g.30309 m.30309 type:complete len:784 (+) comp4691_c0_seq1:38-2389(+)